MPRVCAALLWLLHALSAPPAAAFSSRGPTATRLVPSYAGPRGKYLQRGGPSPSDEDRFSDDEDWEMKGSGIDYRQDARGKVTPASLTVGAGQNLKEVLAPELWKDFGLDENGDPVIDGAPQPSAPAPSATDPRAAFKRAGRAPERPDRDS